MDRCLGTKTRNRLKYRTVISLLFGITIAVYYQSIWAQQDRFSMPIVVDVPPADSYTSYTNIVYRKQGETKVLADIYTPKQGASYPGVIFVHGGPILDPGTKKPKDWTFFQNYGALVTKQDMVGVTFNHRMNSLQDFDTPAEDVLALTQYVQNMAADYAIDKNKVCVWFYSGGGFFVAPLLRENPKWLQCIVVYYGAMGIDAFKSQEGVSPPIDNPQLYNPIPVLQSTSIRKVPIFIAIAGEDNPSLNSQLKLFAQTALDNNWPVEIWNHPTGPHGFDILKNDDRSKAIIHRTVEFVTEQLE